jgi:hypothetical protein
MRASARSSAAAVSSSSVGAEIKDRDSGSTINSSKLCTAFSFCGRQHIH